MSSIKLVLADVDGTLVTHDKILTKRAQEQVRALEKAGIAFAITSGRPPRGMTMLIEPLALQTPIAAFNGGLFVDAKLQILEQRVLPRKVVEQAMEIIQKHELDVWIYRGSDWFVHERHGPHVDREEWTVKFPPTVLADYSANLDDVAKIVGVSDDLPRVARCEMAVQEKFEDNVHCRQSNPARVHEAANSEVSAARSQPYYLDVTHPEANKGAVVRWLSERLKIPTEQIATIGDMPNDISMFQESGMSIAMGQASDEVKKAATHVTTSSEDEGFANALERFVLDRAGG